MASSSVKQSPVVWLLLLLQLLGAVSGAHAAGDAGSPDRIMIILISILLFLCVIAMAMLFYSGAGAFCTCPIYGSRTDNQARSVKVVHRGTGSDGLEYDDRVEVVTTTVQRTVQPGAEVTVIQPQQQQQHLQQRRVVNLQQEREYQLQQQHAHHTQACVVDMPSYGRRPYYDPTYVPVARSNGVFVPPPREFPAAASRRTNATGNAWTEETDQVLVEREFFDEAMTPPPRPRNAHHRTAAAPAPVEQEHHQQASDVLYYADEGTQL